MLTYTLTGKKVHITQDGKITQCGKNCEDWSQETAPTNWIGTKTDCAGCGTPAAFVAEREKIVEDCRLQSEAAAKAEVERKERWQKRQMALAAITGKWQAILSEHGVLVDRELLPGAGKLTLTDTQDGLHFEVKVTINW